MKKCILVPLTVFCLANEAWASNIETLKNMFTEMVVKKDISVMSKYYTPDFKLFSNGKTMDYKAYYLGHASIYKTPIQYEVSYDNDTLVESDKKVAARVFITTKTPHSKATKIEVILVAQFKDNRISKLWELTYPNWTKLKSFKSFSK